MRNIIIKERQITIGSENYIESETPTNNSHWVDSNLTDEELYAEALNRLFTTLKENKFSNEIVIRADDSILLINKNPGIYELTLYTISIQEVN